MLQLISDLSIRERKLEQLLLKKCLKEPNIEFC